jgi:uncharacterized protein (DUF779 family)
MLDLDHIFSYHPPTDEKLRQYDNIRRAAKDFAAVILANTPECADQSAAICYVRDATMTANQAAALDGRLTVAERPIK